MYGYSKETKLSFKETLERLELELKNQNFGIITRIDVKETLKQKLGVESKDYMIIGACNPKLAHKVLLAEKEIGLFLPCNIIVYENEKGKTQVSAMLPTVMMKAANNEELGEVAGRVEAKLKNVVDNLVNNENYFQCPECGLFYEEKRYANECKKWCKRYDSCNLKITAHATKQ